MEVPEMIVPIYESAVVPRLLVLADEDKKKLAGPAAWLGSSVLVSFVAFIVLTFSPLIRIADRRSAIPAGAARTWAWLSATTSVAAVSVLGAAIAVTADSSMGLPLFGFVPWAVYGAWAGLVAGIFGLVTLWVTVRARKSYGLPGSRVIGFFLTGIAASVLSAFLLTWDLGPV
jgi:hypothetical protein